MRGRIKTFNQTKGFGFITGEDSNDYFVHISDLAKVEPIINGAIVEFQPFETTKGKAAKEILPCSSPTTHPPFIAFGDKRVRLNQIKNYGINERTVFFSKIFEPATPCKNPSIHQEWVWNGKTAYLTSLPYENAFRQMSNYTSVCGWNYLLNGSIRYSQEHLNGKPADFDDVTITKQLKCLYISTYQQDYYEFYEGEVKFDIFQKYQELDDYLL